MSLAQFKARTIMPAADVDRLEALFSGWIQQMLDDWSDEIDARLRKRYAVPFNATTPPRVVLRWLKHLGTRDAYAKRGWNPTSEMDREAIVAAAETALAELKEAADAQNGLFDLPVLASSSASGVSKGFPFVYSEQSPYTWTDLEVVAGRGEDSNGGKR